MGPRRGGRAALLLSRLALRHQRAVHRHAVRDRRVPQAHGCLAPRLPDDGIWRAGLRLHGPPGTEPLIPMYDIIDTRHRDDVLLGGMRLWGDYSIGFVKDCNWLQHYENIVDPWHLLVLHQMISGDQFEGALMQGAPRIEFEKTALGVRYNLIKDLPNGNRFERHAECIVPDAFIIPDIRETGRRPKREERGSELSWAVPVDNEHVTGLSIVAWPLEDGEPKKDWRPGTDTVQDIRPGSVLTRRRASGRSPCTLFISLKPPTP